MAAEVVYFFTPLVLLLIPENCHDEFFVRFNFFNAPCLKLAISKLLGYAIITGSMIVKVPQIVKLLQARSAVGLSILSLLVEMTNIAFTFSYSVQQGYPFSAWGEVFFLAIQNIIIVILTFYYNKNYMGALLSAPLYCAFIGVLASPITPLSLHFRLQQSALVFIATGRLLQIWTNLCNGHTGHLSLITTLLIAAGSIARVFTSVQETGDTLVILQYVLASSLNCVILLQIFWYWNVALPENILKKKAQ